MALTIGQLAQRSGIPATTLRYYDALGLLVAERLANGHRRYPEAAVERLDLIRTSRMLGLSLDEIGVVFGPGGGELRRQVARRKLDELEATLARLRAVHAVLTHLAGCRHTAQQAGDCGDTVRDLWAGLRGLRDEAGPGFAHRERR